MYAPDLSARDCRAIVAAHPDDELLGLAELILPGLRPAKPAVVAVLYPLWATAHDGLAASEPRVEASRTEVEARRREAEALAAWCGYEVCFGPGPCGVWLEENGGVPLLLPHHTDRHPEHALARRWGAHAVATHGAPDAAYYSIEKAAPWAAPRPRDTVEVMRAAFARFYPTQRKALGGAEHYFLFHGGPWAGDRVAEAWASTSVGTDLTYSIIARATVPLSTPRPRSAMHGCVEAVARAIGAFAERPVRERCEEAFVAAVHRGALGALRHAPPGAHAVEVVCTWSSPEAAPSGWNATVTV